MCSRDFCLYISLNIHHSFFVSFSVASPEYCSGDTFRASCADGSVIMMQTAQYGRMRPGRCITAEYQHVMKCQTDVLSYMDQHCAGLAKCEVVVGSLDQVAEPCQRDFKSFLEASYECVQGEIGGWYNCAHYNYIPIIFSCSKNV